MKNIAVYLVCFFCFIFLISASRFKKGGDCIASSSDDNPILFSCSYVSNISPEDCLPDGFGSFSEENLSIAMVLQKILGALAKDSSMKVTPNFLPYECSFSQPVFKALTKRNDSTRYILYTKKQLQELIKANTNWVAYSIFAHEIGHHLYGHSLSNAKSLEESRRRELQADFFSGYVIHKLSATLVNAQAGINAFTNHPSDDLEPFCTHPSKAKRLLAVQNGYQFASQQGATTQMLLNVDSLRKIKGVEAIFNKSMELFNEKRVREAIEVLEEIGPILKGVEKADFYNNRGFLKREQGDIPGSIRDINAAIELMEKSDYFFNRAASKKSSSQKGLQAESKEDLKHAENLKKVEKNGGF